MTPARRIAVLDVGKTHARLQLLDGPTGQILARSECASRSRPGRWSRELDITGTESWLVDALSALPASDAPQAIVPVAHGAAAVLLDSGGDPVAAPDYEDEVFESVAEGYRPLRDPYELTHSPFLPLGLNLGRQWYYLQESARVDIRHALLYPQYWAWRLSGVMACELTSLGCHTDLWRPATGETSALARNRGWDEWLPPLHRAGEVLGGLTQEMRARTGLPGGCRVLCGIHDSNASYLCHLAAQAPGSRFAVVSSGTWTIVFASGADLGRLAESGDMLANVDARGAPVATARFMGGREYAAIAGEDGLRATPAADTVRQLISQGIFALPSFTQSGGPFAGRSGRVLATRALDAGERASLATLYLALMTDWQLTALGATGKIVIDGPLSGNALYGSLLAALRPDSPVSAATASAGAAQAARILCGHAPDELRAPVSAMRDDQRALQRYAEHWRAQAPG